MPPSSSAHAFNANTTNPQSLAFDSLSSLLFPDAVNAPISQVTPPRTALSSTPNSKPLTTLCIVFLCWRAWDKLGPVSVHSARSRSSTTQDMTRFSRLQCTDFYGLSGSPVFHSPHPDSDASLDGLSPAMGDSWANMVNTPLLPLLQKSSTASNNATSQGQIIDLVAAKLNNLYGGDNVPRLASPEDSLRSSRATSTIAAAASDHQRLYSDSDILISGQQNARMNPLK